MTIFQHTVEKVLSGEKCQTSRIWRDGYKWGSNHETIMDAPTVLYNVSKGGDIRRHYYVGQVLSVQPNRGAKGIAKIRVLELARRDVRDFTQEDIRREGFDSLESFLSVWCEMHDKWLYRAMKADKYSNISSRFVNNVGSSPAEFYTVLVIRFELLAEESIAA